MPVEAAVISGPYEVTGDTAVTVPQGYQYSNENGKGTQTYSAIRAQGSGNDVTAAGTGKVSVDTNMPMGHRQTLHGPMAWLPLTAERSRWIRSQ